MARNNIFIVVPNWNGKDLLSTCLDSLLGQTHQAEIIVVDNGSTDGSVDFVKKSYRQVELVELEHNHGFAGGVNAGIKKAMDEGAQFVALFNNDASADPKWLAQLLETMQASPKTGIVDSKILRSDKKHIDTAGVGYSIWGLPFPRGRNELDQGQYDEQQEVFGAAGGGSLYRVQMLKEVGLFDEDFFLYFEDNDISFRAQLAGWKIYYNPLAVAYHKVGVTSSKHAGLARYHSVKNFVLLYAKNMPGHLYFKYLPLAVISYFMLLLRSTLRGQLWTFLKASWAAIKLHPKTFKKRRQIQHTRKVSIEYIDKLLWHGRPPRPPKMEEV